MGRLPSDQIVNLRRQLCAWQTPDEMANLISGIGSEAFFRQAGLDFLRDAWTASEFTRIRSAEKVRIVADEWPDFELCIRGTVEQFEVVEALDPHRRRGDEYREGLPEPTHDPVEDWILRAEQAPAWLEAACKKKAAKHYGSSSNLVVYLNFSEYGIRQKEVENCFAQATSVVREQFEAVWVIWKGKAYLVWDRGSLTDPNSPDDCI